MLYIVCMYICMYVIYSMYIRIYACMYVCRHEGILILPLARDTIPAYINNIYIVCMINSCCTFYVCIYVCYIFYVCMYTKIYKSIIVHRHSSRAKYRDFARNTIHTHIYAHRLAARSAESIIYIHILYIYTYIVYIYIYCIYIHIYIYIYTYVVYV